MPMPNLWSYERLPGTMIEGFGEPGRAVVTQISLRVRDQVVLRFAAGEVGRDGSWSIRVPLKPGADYGSVSVGDAFLIGAGDLPPEPYLP